MSRDLAARSRVVASAASVALAALLLWRCAASPERAVATGATSATEVAPSEAAPAATATPPTEPVAALPSTSAPSRTPVLEPAAPVAAAPSAAASASSGASAIIAAVGRRDPRDLALLSRIERELKRDPPEAVHALIRLREGGAGRNELLARAAQLPAGDLALRVLVRRWIDEVQPDPSASKPSSPNPAPSGSQRPLVKPIERATAP